MTQTATDIDARPLPAGWKWVKLEDVCESWNGYWGDNEPQNDSIEAICLGVGNITNEGFINVNSASNRHFAGRQQKAIAQLHDILVVKSSGSASNIRSGKAGLVDSSLAGKVAATNFIMLLRPDTSVVNPYLLWLMLNSDSAKTFVRLIAGSTTYPNIKWSSYKNLSIPLPPLEEQKRIAAILNEQMAAVEQAKKSAEERLEAVKALPAAYLREVFEGEEYETWVEYSLDEIMEFKNGVNFAGDKKGQGLLTIDVLNMYSENIYPNYDGLYRVDIAPPKEYYLNAGDVLFVRSSVKKEGVGWASLFDGFDEPITYCGFIIRGRLKNESISPEFIVHQLRSYQVRQEIIESSGTSAITNISQQKLKAIPLRIPQQEQQIEIVARLGDKLAGVSLAEKSIQQELQTIEALPSSLLRKAFAGEL